MRRKTVFSLILVLVFSLVLVPVVDAFCLELKYDDGIAEAGITAPSGSQMGVKFSLPQNWRRAQIVMARFFISGFMIDFEVHVYDLDGNDLVQPFKAPASTLWVDVPLNVMVSGDFYIAIESISDKPEIGRDMSSNQGHSYWRPSSTDPWQSRDYNYMIRAVVCELPVGGELVPNSVSTVGTWIIAVISIIGASIGMAYKKRKRS